MLLMCECVWVQSNICRYTHTQTHRQTVTSYLYCAVHTKGGVLLSIGFCCYPKALSCGVRGTVSNMHIHAEYVKCKPPQKAKRLWFEQKDETAECSLLYKNVLYCTQTNQGIQVQEVKNLPTQLRNENQCCGGVKGSY